MRAYAAGEAVQARPDGWPGKVFRFVRRHSKAAAIFAAAFALLLVGWTVAATIIAALDRRALDAERQVAESAARAQKRLQAFAPYAEATDLLMRGQLYDRAAQLLDDALKIDPQFPEAQFALGKAQRLSGNPALAAQAYLKANELSRQLTGRPHLQALLAAGMSFDGAGDYARSEEAFQQAEKEGADHPLALVGKTFRLGHERKFRDAKQAADQALRQGPHFWETHFAAGYVTEELADAGFLPPDAHHQAIAHFRKALELSPRQAEAIVWLARACGDTDSAEYRAESNRLFDQAIALEPRNGNRYINRAIIRLGSGDSKGSQVDVQKAKELNANRSLVLHAETLLAFDQGDVERAYRNLGELVKKLEGLAAAHRQLGDPGFQPEPRRRGPAALRGMVPSEPGVSGGLRLEGAGQGAGTRFRRCRRRRPRRPAAGPVQSQAAHSAWRFISRCWAELAGSAGGGGVALEVSAARFHAPSW